MANHDGFSSSEIMYPTVTTAGQTPQAMVPATPYAAPLPAFGGGPRVPEIVNGTFNQTWLINCLRRRWLMALVLGTLLAAAMGGLLLWLFPLSSSITAMVHVQQETTDIMEKQQRFSPQELDVFQATQLAQIKSQYVLSSALAPPKIAQLEAVRKEEPDPITWLQENLQVGFQGETLFVRYDGEEDSQEMKYVVDAVIAAYEQEVIGGEKIRTAQMRKDLKTMHTELANELHEKIEKYQTLAEELGGAESQTATTVLNMLINEIRQIQGQIIKKKDELIEITVNKELAVQQLSSQSAIERAVAAALDEDPYMANYKADQYALSSQIRQQRGATKRGTSAQIKRLEAQMRQLQQDEMQYRQQAEAEIRQALKTAPNDGLQQVMTEFMLRRNSITNDIAELEAKLEEKLAEIDQKGISDGELSMLSSEIEQLQEVEGEMEYKLRTWEIQDSAKDDLFRVLQPATATEQINSIQRYAIAGLGGIAAFCATCYGVALIEFRRRRLNGATDVDEGLGLRVLGVLPPVSSRKAMAPGSLLSAQLSESIDNVRATLMHDSTSSKHQVVLVTSPATMEGTTTVASHLALSLTRAGRRTLLIDGDIREPALHKLFGMPMEDGLCEVLRSDIDVADAVRPTNTEGLWLLTAGHCDMESIHALATDQPQPIFEKLREEFDFIIIDGAPVLGISDSIQIGQYVDGAILTVLRDHSEVRKVYQAIELLKGMGVRILGSVVNGVPLKADRRIVKLHKASAKKPRKIEAAKATPAASKAAAKPEEPIAASPTSKTTDPIDDLGDIDLNDDVEIDFDDLGLED